MRKELGLVHVYTGDGKGKTTAAFGLALRAAGQGFRVCIVQFMKETVKEAGELKSLEAVPRIEVHRFGRNFVEKPPPTHEEVSERVAEGLDFTEKVIASNQFDLLILDEIVVALYFKVADEERVFSLIKKKPPHLELLLTGRKASPELIRLADLVTEMKLVKHPYDRGLTARKGIEY